MHCSDAAARRPYQQLTGEKGSALLVRIRSLWAESGPPRRRLYFAIWKDETNSFAQLGFLFSRALDLQQQSDLASERSRHPARAFSLIATQIGRLSLPQRVPQPPAFLQASVLKAQTSSHAPWICVALVSGILQQAVQKAPGFAWEARVLFPGQRLLPAHVFFL